MNRSAFLAQNEEVSLAKRKSEELPQSLMASIEDLASSRKTLVTPDIAILKYGLNKQLSKYYDDDPQDENVHPNIRHSFKVSEFSTHQWLKHTPVPFGRLSRPAMQPIQLNHPSNTHTSFQ